MFGFLENRAQSLKPRKYVHVLFLIGPVYKKNESSVPLRVEFLGVRPYLWVVVDVEHWDGDKHAFLDTDAFQSHVLPTLTGRPIQEASGS